MMTAVILFFCISAVALVGFLCIISAAVCHKTADRIVTIEDLSAMEGEFDYVLVLGCKVYEDGTMSARLHDRVQVGIQVFERISAEHLLMSGDRHAEDGYDEVGAMRRAAVEAGISEEKILTDPRGFSTYESVVRLLQVYRGQRVVIVTQEYHLYRALYIAEKLGIEAFGVSADLRPYRDQVKCELREIAARVKDVYYVQAKKDVDCTTP